MTEITQADRDAAAQYDVVEAFARHRKYGYDQGYYDGRQFDRMEALEAALREVFEEWAGSEGFIPETAPEGYLLQLTKRMADIARAALGEKQ